MKVRYSGADGPDVLYIYYPHGGGIFIRVSDEDTLLREGIEVRTTWCSRSGCTWDAEVSVPKRDRCISKVGVYRDDLKTPHRVSWGKVPHLPGWEVSFPVQNENREGTSPHRGGGFIVFRKFSRERAEGVPVATWQLVYLQPERAEEVMQGIDPLTAAEAEGTRRREVSLPPHFGGEESLSYWHPDPRPGALIPFLGPVLSPWDRNRGRAPVKKVLGWGDWVVCQIQDDDRSRLLGQMNVVRIGDRLYGTDGGSRTIAGAEACPFNRFGRGEIPGWYRIEGLLPHEGGYWRATEEEGFQVGLLDTGEESQSEEEYFAQGLVGPIQTLVEEARAGILRKREYDARCAGQQEQEIESCRQLLQELAASGRSLSRKDSIHAGNCPRGTDAFRAKYSLPEELPIEQLLLHPRVEEMIADNAFRRVIRALA